MIRKEVIAKDSSGIDILGNVWQRAVSFVVLACFPSDEIISFNNAWQLAVGFVVLACFPSDEMISLRNHCGLRKA